MLLFVLMSMLAGCSEKQAEDQLPKMLNVDVVISPNVANIDEPVIFQAKVTYGDELVTDADDVSFEIWRDNPEKSETFPVEHSQNGNYALEKTFAEEGTYYVYAHVTARGMHAMPKGEFVIKK